MRRGEASRTSFSVCGVEQVDGNVPLTGEDIPVSGADGTKLYARAGAPNYTYDGRNLQEVFGTAAALHEAVAAGDFSRIRVGDYWPVTLNGDFYDLGDSTSKTLSNALLKMEVAGIDTYYNYGDTPAPHHLLMCSRDCLPVMLKMRSADTTWYNTSIAVPWIGSAMYETLNNATNGLLALLAALDIGSYIYAGPNNAGMRYLGELKASGAATVTGGAWSDRGKIFLPCEQELWGQSIWAEYTWGGGCPVQWPIFVGSMRHMIKGLGNGGDRASWWYASSAVGSPSDFCYLNAGGRPGTAAASSLYSVPICCLFV